MVIEFFKHIMCPTAVVRDWTCVILLLQDVRNKIEEKPTGARGFLEKLKSFRYELTIYCPQDFLEILLRLSLILYRKDLFLSLMGCHVERSFHSVGILHEN